MVFLRKILKNEKLDGVWSNLVEGVPSNPNQSRIMRNSKLKSKASFPIAWNNRIEWNRIKWNGQD